jgi:acetyl-CoA carboxylase carboxyl transferase subunit alpha
MSSKETNIKTTSAAIESDHPWERVKSARKENRPQAQDYISKMFHGVYEMKGDKVFGDDPSIITAIGWFESWAVTIIGQQKGHTLEERMKYNFGMPSPEGYRKSIRALKQAEKFGRPIICFVDTPGAYHGVEAETRGQGLIIAEHLKAMATVKAPVISIIIGEGGSGGALALSLADRLIMLENSYFSVISPEGCASILFKDSSLAQTAAESLKLTSEDLKKFNIVDSVIKEQEGFNRFNMDKSVADVSKELKTTLRRLTRIDPAKLVEKRHQKFLGMRGL